MNCALFFSLSDSLSLPYVIHERLNIEYFIFVCNKYLFLIIKCEFYFEVCLFIGYVMFAWDFI